jgi:hypothetical protein
MSGDLVQTLAVAAAQLPPEVQKSLLKVVVSMIKGVARVPVAWLDAKVAVIQAKKVATTAVIEAAGRAAANAFAQDPSRVEDAIDVLAEPLLGKARSVRSVPTPADMDRLMAAEPEVAARAATFAENRAINEQINRESIAYAAIEELKNDPPSADAKSTVRDDWIDDFTRVAEKRSEPEMQAYFARILAGEIRSPGSFSLGTLDVASKLTTETAVMFLNFCNASVSWLNVSFVPTEPLGGDPGNNSLEPVGLPYGVLKHLEDVGLVQGDLNANWTLPPMLFTHPFEIAGVTYRAAPKDPTALHPEATVPRKFGAINFTQAGKELRRIVQMSPNLLLVEKLADRLRAWDLELKPL